MRPTLLYKKKGARKAKAKRRLNTERKRRPLSRPRMKASSAPKVLLP